MAYKHGVYVAEQGTSIVAPVTATAGLQVVIGTAPINRASDPYHCTNTPMLANTLAGATAAVGYDDDYEKYTVCQSMGASFKVVGVSPMILINVLDPNKHKKNLPEKTVQVNDGVAVVEEKDILLDKLTVKAEETPLAAGTDYTAAFDDNGYVNIVVIPGGAGDSATSLTVSGVQIDPTAVTPADIVGAVTADGVESGMEVIRQIFPKLNMTPGILLAPGWSENALVSAGLQAKTSHINGVFNCACIVDIDSSTAGATKYDDVKRQKEKQAVTSANCYAVWLYAKVGDVIYAELSDSTSELVPVGVVSPGSFYTTTKAGVLNGCETHDGFIRFFSQRIPKADIQATVTLFGKGGGSGETGSVSIGQGLKRDASGAIAVRIGEGLDFDSANALTVRKETVMTSEDLLNEEETQQEIVDMLK